MYFLILVMIWCCPDLTADRLLFDALFTAWIVVGTALEERDMVGEFGDGYTTYQQQVPMLIPWKLPGSS
jgi:protein-S-isoprenylcysteine O-methyltransferase Ste14